MSEAAEILVIINSVVLVVFLLVAIIALGYFISTAVRIRRLVEKAERVTDTIGSVGSAIKQAATTLTFGRIVTSIFQSVMNSSDKGKSKGKRK